MKTNPAAHSTGPTANAAGLTVPIAEAGGSWRVSPGLWAAFRALAILPWLSTIRRESRPAPKVPGEPRKLDRRDLAGSPAAWMLTFVDDETIAARRPAEATRGR